MPDEDTTAEIMTTLAVFNTTLNRATEDLKEFSKELSNTKEGVIELKAAHEQCPFRKPEAVAILQKQSTSNGTQWTPKKITNLVATIIAGIGVMSASMLAALKWIAQ